MKFRLPNNKTDMVSMIAQETGRSRELIRLIIDNFEKSLRYYLSNPMESGRAIYLKNFGKFTFDIDKAVKRVHRLAESQRKEFYEKYLNRFSDEEK